MMLSAVADAAAKASRASSSDNRSGAVGRDGCAVGRGVDDERSGRRSGWGGHDDHEECGRHPDEEGRGDQSGATSTESCPPAHQGNNANRSARLGRASVSVEG